MRDITNIKLVEEQFETILRTSLDGFWLMNKQGRFLDVNDAYCQLIGYSREELLTMNVNNVEAVENPEEITQHINKIIKMGGDRFVTRHRAKNGKLVDLEISATYLDIEDGRFVVFLRDITEQKRIQETLQQSKLRLARAQEIAHLGSWELDLVNNRLSWSDEVYRIFGLQPQEFGATYEAFLDAVHPDDRAAVDAAYSGSLRDGKDSYEIEHRLVRKSNGEIRIVRERCQHERDKDGKIIRSVGMVHDITERKQMENRLAHLASFPDLNPNPIIELDISGAINYLNPAAKNIDGLETNGIQHPFLIDVNNILQDMHASNKDYMIRDIKYDEKYYEQAMYRSKDYSGLRIYTRDITKRKKAEEELLRSNENLVQFAYVASHDLQEPLRTIASFSQLLAKRYKEKLDKNADDFLDFIVDAARRMQNLITDILEYSRVDRNFTIESKVECDKVLGKVITSMSKQINLNQAVITCDPLPVLTYNENNLFQLFQNLISNAMKFRQNEPPRVHISVQKQKSEWIFAVKDNGIGIDKKYHDKIFLIFQRLHPKDKYSGTGIGLAICKKIVENYGGRIWVESTLNKGSIFYFTIPIKIAQEVLHEK
ncbi:MAG: PAS domain S-box protein [Candidatus Bathyarchaeota archaeon]|nr:PAS domain S-box protein [Candidatus Bathyarchaeota archaeon]